VLVSGGEAGCAAVRGLGAPPQGPRGACSPGHSAVLAQGASSTLMNSHVNLATGQKAKKNSTKYKTKKKKRNEK